MTYGIPGAPYQFSGQEDNIEARANLIDNLQIDEGYGLAKRFEQTWAMNPFPLLMNNAGLKYEEFFGSKNKISAQEANQKYGLDGLLKFDSDIDADVALRRSQLKQAEVDRNAAIDLMEQQKSNPAIGFGVDLAASLLDPLNIASMFIPVVGEARAASMVARLGKVGGRAAVGAIEGAVGAAILEPIVYAGAKELDYEYSGMDSLMNVTFGTVLGGGMHVGMGAVSDFISKGFVSKNAHEKALRTAISQLVTEDKNVDITTILKADLNDPQKINDLEYQKTVDSIFKPDEKPVKYNQDIFGKAELDKTELFNETLSKSKEIANTNTEFKESIPESINTELDAIIKDTEYYTRKIDELSIDNEEIKIEYNSILEENKQRLKVVDDIASGLRQAVLCLTSKG